MNKSVSSLLPLAAIMFASCAGESAPPAPVARDVNAPAGYVAEVTKWQTDRQARLKKEDSWFTVVGLWWLEEGDNPFGSDREVPVRLPEGKAPPVAGTLTLAKGAVRISAKPGAGVTTDDGKPVTTADLKADADEGGPTMLKIGRVSFYVIKRGDRFAVRVKDPDSAARLNFEGLEYYPVDPSLRVEAKFVPYDPPKRIPIPNITGMTSEEASPGALVFEIAGTTYQLDPIVEEGSDELFVIFADATNGRETYGSGRFLYTKMPENGKVILDFNRAYNPPCAFTAFATCPLPPKQNKLPVAIRAGEKAYHLEM